MYFIYEMPVQQNICVLCHSRNCHNKILQYNSTL